MSNLKILVLLLLNVSLSLGGISVPENTTDTSSSTNPAVPGATFVSNNATYTYQDAWCIWQENGISYSFALTLPNDGSATTDGKDPKCQCGQSFKDKLKKKGVAITSWHCHYGPENSACITFNMPVIPVTVNNIIRPIYRDIEGKDVQCQDVDNGNVVCPKTFPNGPNEGC